MSGSCEAGQKRESVYALASKFDNSIARDYMDSQLKARTELEKIESNIENKSHTKLSWYGSLYSGILR